MNEMSKHAASTPVSCSAKAPQCSFVNDDDFESLQAGYQPKTTLYLRITVIQCTQRAHMRTAL